MAKRKVIHPWPLRLTHWVNAVAIVLMIGSGWQIYDASPLFGFSFPLGLGDWLGAGIAWHLAVMWILVGNALVYFGWGAASGHFGKFFPLSPRAIWRDLRAALRFKLAHQRGVYNAVQKLLYLGVLLAGFMVVFSGLAIWKPVQLWFFCDALGGYFAARYVHFFSMAAILAFMLVHVTLVLLVPKSLPPMLTGGRLPE